MMGVFGASCLMNYLGELLDAYGSNNRCLVPVVIVYALKYIVSTIYQQDHSLPFNQCIIICA